MNIQTRNETKRGCGFRKPGGIYLVAGAPSAPCGRLPIALDVCPTCHHGVKPSRGWTWIDVRPFLDPDFKCPDATPVVWTGQTKREMCMCPLEPARAPERIGLLWIGERYYPTPDDFLREGSAMGISRRVSAIPVDFKIGETWIGFAHRKVIERKCDADGCENGFIQTSEQYVGKIEHGVETRGSIRECKQCDGNRTMIMAPAIFGMFKPTAVEYVVEPTKLADPEYIAKLESLEKRGITLINVNRITDDNQTRVPIDDDPEYQVVEHDDACRCNDCCPGRPAPGLDEITNPDLMGPHPIDGGVIDDIPDDEPGVWHKTEVFSKPDGSLTGTDSTNDNLDTGHPSEHASWPVIHLSLDAFAARYKHASPFRGVAGALVEIFVDGEHWDPVAFANRPDDGKRV